MESTFLIKTFLNYSFPLGDGNDLFNNRIYEDIKKHFGKSHGAFLLLFKQCFWYHAVEQTKTSGGNR